MQKSDFVTDSIETAYEWLKQGKILAYPTESVWGLGCNAFDEQAVKQLLALKNRPMDKGLIVLTSSELLIQDFWQNLPSLRQNEIIQSWQNADARQQATTWLFEIPKNVIIPEYLRGKHTSLAIRIINHAQINKLCSLIASNNLNSFGFLVSTSCNVGGERPAVNFEMAFEYFGDKVCYFKGKTLGCDKPSQIKNAGTDELLRL